MQTQPTNFLLDTNIFVEYIQSEKDDLYVERIIKLINEERINLLITDILLHEWKKKKKERLESLYKEIKAIKDVSKNDPANESLNVTYNRALEKAKLLDSVINTRKVIKTPSSVKAEVADRLVEGKAPFHHGKSKTFNDALIYFTVLDYLKKKKVSEFIFLTKDSDYWDPLSKQQLHPELSDEQVSTLLFTNFHFCFKVLADLMGTFPAEKKAPYQITLLKQGSKDLLTHTYDVIKAYGEKMSFLPSYLLSRIDPFRIVNHKKNFSNISTGTLTTNNDTLIDLFAQVDMLKLKFKKSSSYPNSKANLEKLNFIITTLNKNLIYKIASFSGSQVINIEKRYEEKCCCVRCSYSRLSYDAIDEALVRENDSIEKAFILFQMGRNAEALKIYYQLYKNAVKNKENSAAYRLALSLSSVKDYVYSEEEEIKKIMDDVEAIDLEKAFLNAFHSDQLDKEIALLFRRNNAFENYKLSVIKARDKIKSHYELQLDGGNSSNTNFSGLLYQFAGFERFIIHNGIPYTRYTDFQEVCANYFEGIFMSLALNKDQSSRLDSVDDYLLKQMLFYGNADHLVKLFNKYVKTPIKYEGKDKEFEDAVLNYLSTPSSFIDQLPSKGFGDERSSFYRIFWNLVVLLAIIKFDDKFIRRCFSQINKFIEKLPGQQAHSVHHLASLIESKKKVLSGKPLNEFTRYVIDQPHLHENILLEVLTDTNGQQLTVKLSDKEVEHLIEMFLFKCEKCNGFHNEALANVFSILNTTQQTKFSSSISERLSSSFDPDLYYIAALGDMIPYKKHFRQYLDSFPVAVQKSEGISKRWNGEINYPQLSKLLNLLFKSNVKLPKGYQARFENISDYYDWLLNMEGFDYNKFDPLWILEYPTSYYLTRIFSVKQVKEKVRKYLQDHHHPKLAYYYTQNVI